MVARTAPTAQVDPFWHHPPLPALARTLLVWAIWLLVLVSVSLAARGWAGAARRPLPNLALGAVALAVVASLSILRAGALATQLAPQRPLSRQTVLWFLPTFAALMLAAFLSCSGSPPLGLILLWSTLVVVEAAWNGALWRTCRTRPAPVPAANREPGPGPNPTGGHPQVVGESDDELEGHGDALPDEVCQQLTRSRAEQPGDTMSGLLRAHFQPQERSRSLHVAFCPPMPRPPRVEIIQVSGPRARIKPGEVQAFGVRFDLRLLAPSTTEQTVMIHFEATCSDLDRSERTETEPVRRASG
jgi:hypothetical protein